MISQSLVHPCSLKIILMICCLCGLMFSPEPPDCISVFVLNEKALKRVKKMKMYLFLYLWTFRAQIKVFMCKAGSHSSFFLFKQQFISGIRRWKHFILQVRQVHIISQGDFLQIIIEFGSDCKRQDESQRLQIWGQRFSAGKQWIGLGVSSNISGVLFKSDGGKQSVRWIDGLVRCQQYCGRCTGSQSSWVFSLGTPRAPPAKYLIGLHFMERWLWVTIHTPCTLLPAAF